MNEYKENENELEKIKYKLNALVVHYADFVSKNTDKSEIDLIKEIKQMAEDFESFDKLEKQQELKK